MVNAVVRLREHVLVERHFLRSHVAAALVGGDRDIAGDNLQPGSGVPRVELGGVLPASQHGLLYDVLCGLHVAVHIGQHEPDEGPAVQGHPAVSDVVATGSAHDSY